MNRPDLRNREQVRPPGLEPGIDPIEPAIAAVPHTAVWQRNILLLPALFAQQLCGMGQGPCAELQEWPPGA